MNAWLCSLDRNKLNKHKTQFGIIKKGCPNTAKLACWEGPGGWIQTQYFEWLGASQGLAFISLSWSNQLFSQKKNPIKKFWSVFDNLLFWRKKAIEWSFFWFPKINLVVEQLLGHLIFRQLWQYFSYHHFPGTSVGWRSVTSKKTSCQSSFPVPGVIHCPQC